MSLVFVEPISDNIGMFVPAYPLACWEVASFVQARWPRLPVHVLSLPLDYGLALSRQGVEDVHARVLKDLAVLRPMAVGISCSAIAQARQAMALARQIKADLPGVAVFMGGYLPTLYPSQMLTLCPELDWVVCGEGEETAGDIAGCLLAGKDPRQEAVAGLAWRSEGRLWQTGKRPRFDLRRKVPLNPALLTHATACHVLAYAFSRGCPYRCAYCMEDQIRPQRQQVPAEVVSADLKTLLKAGSVHTIVAGDALFQSFELLPVLRDKGVKIHFETRCDAMDPGLLAGIADGCGLLALGLESASMDTLRRMNKVSSADHGRRYLAGAEALFQQAAAHAIPLALFMIAGYPGDTAADLAQSLDFARRLAAQTGAGGHVFKVGECHVYPGTRTESLARTLPDVVFDDDGVLGQNVVRQPSAGLGYDAVQAFMGEVFGLSRIAPALERQLAAVMPFFRMPVNALADPLLPPTCYHDHQRQVLRTSGPALGLLTRIVPELRTRYLAQAARDRTWRRLDL